jgi:hypothetical protein
VSGRRGGLARAALALAAAVALAALPAPAHAALEEARYRVVLLAPPATDEITTDAVARVRGELTAAGFDVREIPLDPALDVRVALQTSGRDLDPIATFAIIRSAPGATGAPGSSTAEIWVSDRIAGKSVIQSVHLDRDASEPGGRGAVVLAVAAVELLKASLAQYWIGPARPTRPATTEPVPASGGAVTAGPAPRLVTAGVAVEAGVAWLDSFGAVGGVLEPVVRASYGGRGGWAGRVSVAGFGTETELRVAQGSASLAQAFGTVELVRVFRLASRLQLYPSAGAGAYRLRVGGTGDNGNQGRQETAWSGLAIAGAGLALAIVPHLALAAEAQALVTWPHTVVAFMGTDASQTTILTVEPGRTGWPSLLVSGGVVGTF